MKKEKEEGKSVLSKRVSHNCLVWFSCSFLPLFKNIENHFVFQLFDLTSIISIPQHEDSLKYTFLACVFVVLYNTFWKLTKE